jgi:mono/diheme cytochrome c family protein
MKNVFKIEPAARTIFLLLFILIISGCNRSRNNPGWDYFPDMFYSTAYETNSPNPNFIDGMTMRVPVNGTLPRGFTPFEYTIDAESRIKAGKELVNPISINDESLTRGKAVYTSFCTGCHGSEGDGNGQLYKSGLYPVKPRSLIAKSAVKLKDGEIYHSITLGFGAMGAHGSQIRPDDRWMQVTYIRRLQEESTPVSDIKKGGNNK